MTDTHISCALIDREQLAALDASSAHNVRRYEYGEFDTVKTEHHKCHTVEWKVGPNERVWHCVFCGVKAAGDKPTTCLAPASPSLIQTREETHGDFTVNSHVSQAIKRAIRAHPGYMSLHDYQKESLDHIAGKVGRIIAGDASFADHWIDIEGYARLVVQRLEGGK